MEDASKLSEQRRDCKWDIAELNRKINRTMQRLQDQEKETGTREEIIAAYRISKEKYDEQCSQLKLLEETSEVPYFVAMLNLQTFFTLSIAKL